MPGEPELSRRRRVDLGGGTDLAAVADLDDHSELLLRVEVVMYVIVDPSGLDDGESSVLEVFDRGWDLRVRHHVFDVVQSRAMVFKVFPVDIWPRDGLDELHLYRAHPRYRADEVEPLGHHLALVLKVANRFGCEVPHVPRPDSEDLGPLVHARVHRSEEHTS